MKRLIPISSGQGTKAGRQEDPLLGLGYQGRGIATHGFRLNGSQGRNARDGFEAQVKPRVLRDLPAANSLQLTGTKIEHVFEEDLRVTT